MISCLFRNAGNVRRGRKTVSVLAWRANCLGAPGPAGGKLPRHAAREPRFHDRGGFPVIVTGRSPRSWKETGLTVGMAPQRTSRTSQQDSGLSAFQNCMALDKVAAGRVFCDLGVNGTASHETRLSYSERPEPAARLPKFLRRQR